ncbi:MAG: pantoate--beta-alanine ligase [Planctomycetota bacterium]
MRLANTHEQLNDAIGAGARAVFVPTMGALHAGHEALIRRAHEIASDDHPVVVSVFVNPTQFDEASDFERYPRNMGDDARTCERLGVSALFAPEASEVYPDGAHGVAEALLPGVARSPALEDAARPGHFAGVYAVVRRLFELVSPGVAIFGEKDWQQLQVVRALVDREGMDVEIVGVETVREPGGVAMSSRNTHLSPEQRSMAGAVPKALMLAAAEPDPERAERAARGAMASAGLEVEYAAVRDAETLLAPSSGRSARVLVAARAGRTRLIDNAPWPGWRFDAKG